MRLGCFNSSRFVSIRVASDVASVSCLNELQLMLLMCLFVFVHLCPLCILRYFKVRCGSPIREVVAKHVLVQAPVAGKEAVESLLSNYRPRRQSLLAIFERHQLHHKLHPAMLDVTSHVASVQFP